MNTILVSGLVLQVVVFAILVFFVRRLLLHDTLQAVQRIRQVESDVARKEESVRRQIEEHEQEYSRRQQELQEEMERRRQAAEKELEQVRQTILADARKQGEALVAQSRANEEKLREDLARDMRLQAVEAAGEIFRLVVSDTVTPVVNAAFVEELIDAVNAVDATSLHVETDDAEFASSHPLLPEVRDRLHRVLQEKFDLDLEVRERVDPDLLAGLVMKLGTLELDGSLRSRLREAVVEVKKTAAHAG